MLVLSVPTALATGIAALSMYFVCRSTPLRPARWVIYVSRRAAAAMVLALLITGAAMLWNVVGGLIRHGGLVVIDPWGWSLFAAFQAAVYVVSAVVHDAVLIQQAAQMAKANETQAHLLAREMEVKALRNQLDPHFLFNSLNAISALIRLDPDAARAMTIDLAEFFRLTLDLADLAEIRLEEELSLVRRYLAIETLRMGTKLQLHLDVEPGALVARLPPLVLQPLVENAVKHGVRLLDDGGVIEVHVRRVADRLLLRVSNPTEASALHDGSGLGQGLRLLRSWLDAQYPESTFVQVQASADRHTVEVSLPWRT